MAKRGRKPKPPKPEDVPEQTAPETGPETGPGPEPIRQPQAETVGELKAEPVEVHALSSVKEIMQTEIDSQIATAKRYPRSVSKFKADLLTLSTADIDTAQSCIYSLPRAGRTLIGVSVRFAEIALSCFKNCVARGIITGEDARYVHAVGMCRDLENNVAVAVDVQRRIVNKHGERFNDDMISMTANAAVSIALRNAIFKVIPAAYTREAQRQIKKVIAGDSATMVTRRANAIKYLQTKFSISSEAILQTLGRRSVEDIDQEDLVALIGYINSIKDGEADIENIFGTKKVKPTQAELMREAAGMEQTARDREAAELSAQATDTGSEEKQPTQQPDGDASSGSKGSNLFM